MARAVLASEMLARLRRATDTENDTHVTDAELYLQLSSAVSETWDYILLHGLGGEYIKNITFNTVAGQQEYPITAIAADFYKVKTLYVTESASMGQYRPLPRITPNEEYGMRPPNGVFAMKLYYVPAAPVWIFGSESFDGINGWEEHTVMTAAISVKTKKQDDTGQYRARKRELEERIKVHANRNADEPPRVIRRRRVQAMSNLWAPYSPQVTHWDLRGVNLELFYTYGVYAT